MYISIYIYIEAYISICIYMLQAFDIQNSVDSLSK